jgi:hypothetical protein
METTIF